MATEASTKSGGARSFLGIGLIGLGALLITLALAFAFFVVPAQKKTPLDTTSLSLTEPAPGNTLVPAAFAAGEPVDSRADLPECELEAADEDAEAAAEAEATAEGEAPAEDEMALAADGEEATLPMACFMENGVPIYTQRSVSTVEPSDSDVVTLQAAQSVLREDIDSEDGTEGLISATVDRVTTDRVTAEPVDEPTSTLKLVSGGDPESDPAPTGFVREGLQYKFPFDTEQTSYDYFDASTFTTNPIDFVEETEVNGVTAYKFEQDLGPINMFESIRDHYAETEDGYSETAESVLTSYRLDTATAGQWGLEGDADREVTMDRFYTNKRTLWVSPETGQILNGNESQFQFFAEDQEEAEEFFSNAEAVADEKADPTRTAVFLEAAWDEETKAAATSSTQESADTLRTFGTTVPLVLGVLGVLALIAGAVVGLRGGGRARA